MSLKVVSVSPVLFWVQQFLEASWAATNLTQSFLQPLENPCGIAMATPRSSQQFPGLCASVYFLLWSTPSSHPTLNIRSYLFPLQGRDTNSCSARTTLTLQKLAITSQFFLRISVSSPHALQAFPCRCLGSCHLIKMHMQQREISKVIRSYVVWNVILKYFFLPTDYRGRHR